MIPNTVLDALEFRKVLNYISKYTVTEPGKSILLSTQPFEDASSAKENGEIVTQAKEVLIRGGIPPFEFIPDLREPLAISRVEGALLESKKILQILHLSRISRYLYSFLKDNSSFSPFLFEKAKDLFCNKLFEHHILSVLTEAGDVKDSASKKLTSIRSELNEKKQDLQKLISRLVKDLNDQNLVREDYITLREGRVVVPIKAEHKRRIKGFIHSESATGQTVYIEPEETLNMNNEIVSLYFAEKREIERILKELTRKISEVSYELSASLDIISHFDKYFALAGYSIEVIGSFPVINKSGNFFLKEGRHPLLINKIGKEKTVPLSFTVDGNKVIIVTGPNAGGKTVVLKTIGLLSLMVQSGIHIPASPDSSFPFFKQVFIDIGDKQSIEDDLSTFSSHLDNLKNILQLSCSDSLVLLDEIGTGTEPSAGSALATAVLISLKKKNALVFAATHHGNLKMIATHLEGFENASMEFDSKELKPTYKFRQGVPGSSYAFEIAKRIGFDDNFLSLSTSYLKPEQEQIDKMLIEMETGSQELNTQLSKAVNENKRLSGLIFEYEEKLKSLEKDKKSILKETKEKAEQYLQDVNKKVQLAIKEIKEKNASKETIKQINTSIKEIKESVKVIYTEPVEVYDKNHSFATNDVVMIKDTGVIGRIIELNEHKSKATVLAGSIKLQVKLKDIIPAKEEKKKTDTEYRTGFSIEALSYRLDIRGEKPEEAEFEILKFLDNSYSSGGERVEILHGKGTGALKKTVKEILTKYEKVKKFYFAPVEYGGEGITIVEFK